MKHDAKRLTLNALTRMKEIHDEWWEKAHCDDEKQYMKAREKMFAMYAEYGPQLVDLARIQLLREDR